MNEECTWKNVFEDAEVESLNTGFFITGFVSIVFGLWLNASILLTSLCSDSSYRNLANFTLVACIRRIVPVIAHIPFLNTFGSGNINSKSCEIFAFVETFLAVFEVEWLTHVCIERYVVAKYATNGWPMQKHHYTLFKYLCLFFASVYSFPPVLGVGRYGPDFSCSSCTFDVVLQDSWQRYAVVIIFALRSIKPALVMLMMLIWARILERKLNCSEETQCQMKFTKNVIIVTLLNQLCWSPIALIRGGTILSLLTYSQPSVIASAFFIKWAMWMHWMAPAFTALTLFAADCNIRDKMFQLYPIETNELESDKTKED